MIIIIKLDRVLLLKGDWPDNKYTCRIAGKQGGGKDCATYRITVDNFFNALIEALDYDVDVSEYQSDTSFLAPTRSPVSHFVRVSVRPGQTCLKVSIFILEQSGSVSGQSKVSLRSV